MCGTAIEENQNYYEKSRYVQNDNVIIDRIGFHSLKHYFLFDLYMGILM